MPQHRLGAEDALFFDHRAPTRDGGITFVFFNALTGDSASWEARIAPALRAVGHGTLTWNLRGQTDSPFGPGLAFSVDQIVDDALSLLKAEAPARPVYVGLSIGGLFAARAHLGGAEALGLVLINTLRKDGPRLRWLNDALVRCAEVGGLELLRDLYLPLLMGEAWLAENRASFLRDAAYTPLSREAGAYKLLASSGTADWNLPYEDLRLPVVVVTGLQDRVFYDPADVEELAGRLPDGHRVDVGAAGHLLPTELPEVGIDVCLNLGGRL